MTHDLLGFRLCDAKKALDSEGYSYSIELYSSPKKKEDMINEVSSRVIKIVEIENKNLKLIVSNF